MTAAELRAKCVQLKTLIRSLTQEHDRLAPVAVNGDARGPEARARIAAIFAERAGYVSELETCEAALRSPEYRPRPGLDQKLERIEANYLRKKQRMQGFLRGGLITEYEKCAATGFVIGACVLHPIANKTITLAELPRVLASMQTREYYVADDIAKIEHSVLIGGSSDEAHRLHFGGTGAVDDRSEKLAALRAELAVLKRHTDDLLSTTALPYCPDDPAEFVRQWAPQPPDVPTNRGRGIGHHPERA